MKSSTITKLTISGSVIALMIAFTIFNVFASRHITRLDLTENKIFTLSQPSLETLRKLKEPIEINILLSSEDALSNSLQNLVEMYKIESKWVRVRTIDPDKSLAEFLAFQRKYNILEGKNEEGQATNESPIVLVFNGNPTFVSLSHLSEQDIGNTQSLIYKMEQAITVGFRRAIQKEKPVICFSQGHGEPTLEENQLLNIRVLVQRLKQNNFEVEFKSSFNVDVISTCRLAVVIQPTLSILPSDISSLVSYLEHGGNILLALGPNLDEGEKSFQNLDPLFQAIGIQIKQEFIFEQDPKAKPPNGYGETFFPTIHPHSITQGMQQAVKKGYPVVVSVAQRLEAIEGSHSFTFPLLSTSENSFAMKQFDHWANENNGQTPQADVGDKKGPLWVAAGSEWNVQNKWQQSSKSLVLGSVGMLLGANWEKQELRGTSLFVENAISWLTSTETLVEIPKKPPMMTSLQISEEDLSQVIRNVVVYIPLLIAFVGLLIHLRRHRKIPTP